MRHPVFCRTVLALNAATVRCLAACDWVVSLFGTPPTRAARDRAAKATAKVDAVTMVQNNPAIVAGA